LTAAPRSARLTARAVLYADTTQTSPDKFDRCPHAPPGFRRCALDGHGLRDLMLARPPLTPRIRFVSLDSCVCSPLPPDDTSRGRPCGSPPSPPLTLGGG